MSHSLPNTFPSWPENLKSELIASIGDYMRQQDADYDVDAFAVRFFHFDASSGQIDASNSPLRNAKLS